MPKKAPERRSLLETELFINRYTEMDVGEVIGHSVSYVSGRINGRSCFTVDEAYKILEFLGKKPEDICVYFPPKGGRPDE